MKQKDKIILYLFLFFFPIIYIIVSFIYTAITIIGSYDQDEILTTKVHCITKYSNREDDKIYNAYVIENLFSQKYHKQHPLVFLLTKGVFLAYYADSKQSDTTVTVSFNKDDKELTVTHNINSADILIQKDKMHGIKIKYITNNSESEDDKKNTKNNFFLHFYCNTYD